MFTMLVGLPDGGLLGKERLLEGADVVTTNRFNPGGGHFTELTQLPCLAMPEFGPDGSTDVARVGAITHIADVGRNYDITFTPDATIAPIPVTDLVAISGALRMEGGFAFQRTRLLIRNADLFRILFTAERSRTEVRPSRRYLEFPDGPIEQDLLVAMMPFDADFNPVWDTVKSAALSSGLRCERADSVWEEDVLLNDIASLLWRARIVVTDYTNRNANVFYETGIAHTLGRQCVPITQDSEIPFDLQSLRAQSYTTSTQGLQTLEHKLERRITRILERG